MHISEPGRRDPLTVSVHIGRVSDTGLAIEADLLAVEEPLEIRLRQVSRGKSLERAISVTMRTPGHDRELAAGFLFSEGIITARAQVLAIHACKSNVVRVDLHPDVVVDLERLQRHFYTASSCGVCGKLSIEAVRVSPSARPTESLPIVEPAVIQRLPEALRAAQVGFDCTGGLHAAALFDTGGKLLCVREDVGRHNALDKLIGAQFLSGQTPLADGILLVSGRASFELVQKAAMAGIPMLAAVGAPSSLAVELARAQGLTLIGFVRHDHFNVYTDTGRVCTEPAVASAVAFHEDRRPLVVI